MASKSASEIFSSPEAGGALSGAASGAATGFMIGGPAGALVGAGVGAGLGAFGANQGAKAAKEDRKRADSAFEKAKELQTKVEQTSSNTATTKGTNTQTQSTTFAPRTGEEQALLDSSIANFQKQGALVDSAENDINARLGTQDAARGTLGNVLSGDAFDLTGSEAARIDALRNADISASSDAVNELLTQRLGEVSADAQRRGLRGQAFTQLQGDALSASARELNRATLEANRTAAQNAITLPGQRVGIQAGAAGQFADFADAAKQTAITNRKALQDPVALQQLLDERLRGGTTSSTQSTDQTVSTTGADTRIGTGEGAANVLAAGIDKPSNAAGGMAGALGVLGTAAQVVGAGAQAKTAFNGSQPQTPKE
jgi:hypothetical protein